MYLLLPNQTLRGAEFEFHPDWYFHIELWSNQNGVITSLKRHMMYHMRIRGFNWTKKDVEEHYNAIWNKSVWFIEPNPCLKEAELSPTYTLIRLDVGEVIALLEELKLL